MAAREMQISKEQADQVSAALLAVPVARQRAVRESIERPPERKPRGRIAAMVFFAAALFGIKSS